MLHTLLGIYMAVFLIGFGGLEVAYLYWLPAEEREADDWWDAPLTILLSGVEFAGLVFLYHEMDAPLLKLIWKPVSILIVVAELFQYLHDMREITRQPSAHEDAGWINGSELLIGALLLPALVLNLYYAYS